jgi:hypothetical protein
MLVFYIPRCRKTFPEFSGDTCEKIKMYKMYAQGGIERMSFGILFLTSTSTPRLSYMKAHKM